MPVRAELIRRKLATIRQTVAELRARCPITAERLAADRLLEWAVERGMQIAAEALFDTGNHILSGEFADAADEYGLIPTRLAGHGVISTVTAGRLRSLSGFRNVLVHDYADVDLEKLVQGLDRLDDFDAFVADVETWLASRPIS